MIVIKNVSKTYQINGTKVVALKDVSISISQGDILGIVGTSGAGKSTLIRCVNMLENFEKGEILINGKNVAAFTTKEIEKQRSEIGMIFQQFNLMSQRTVFKNVAYPLEYKGISKAEIKQRVTYLLDLVGIPDKSLAYPAQLSGGQKQRVAIARALAANPKILLCDEATSALDPETTKSILKLLKDISVNLGLTLIFVTHQKEVVKEICNKVVVLEHGEVVERGSTLDIFTKPSTTASKSFIGEINDNEHVQNILSSFAHTPSKYAELVKLIFIGDEADEAYISEISRKYNVNASILFGNIDIIQDETVGILIIKIEGDPENVEKAKEYIRQNNVIVEGVA